jgi:peptidyl-prolyl cis-trans isomerase SurA
MRAFRSLGAAIGAGANARVRAIARAVIIALMVSWASSGCATLKSVLPKQPAAKPSVQSASTTPSAAPTPTIKSATADPSAPAPPPAAVQAAPEPISMESGPVVGKVVASVDGEPITQHEVEDFAAQTGNAIPSGEFASSPIAKKALKAVIAQKLLEQEVKKYDDKVDEAQIDRYLTEVRRDKHMSDAQFRAQIQSSGLSYDDVRKRARMDLEKAMMIEQQVRGKIEISNADIQAFYDSHKSDFTVEKERLRLSQILIAVPPNATPAQVAAAQKKADQVRARAQKGDDFDDLARSYSDDESKANGGELGWFEPSDVMDEILAGVKNLKPGQISPVIRTKHGFHIVKLDEHETPGVRALAEVKDKIRAGLTDEQTSMKLEAWVDSDLAKQHYVEIMNQ